MKKAMFKFAPFSEKQKKVLTWWVAGSPYREKDAIICDGAVRSGKTIIMSLSFVLWAMTEYDTTAFGMAGKTISSFKRNVWFWLVIMLVGRGFKIRKMNEVGDNVVAISKGGIENYFYFFGGKDESSQDLVQGITLGGFFFDEVSIMPESFVNQAVARCSVEDAKVWFNCNPEGPYHWFKVNWIDKLKEKNAYRLHFMLDDNPSLTEKTKDRYKRMFSGIFYMRFILGLWVLSAGIIYDMWDPKLNVYKSKKKSEFLHTSNKVVRDISIDYGTTNPMVYLDIYDDDVTIYVDNLYYHDSKAKGYQKTDSQYADDLEKFIAEVDKEIRFVIVDPSAASFKAELRQRGLPVKDADNAVADGIRNTATMIQLRKLKFKKSLKIGIGEMLSYVWDEKASMRGVEQPTKDKDHVPDAIRYYIKTMIKAWRLLDGKEN